jgi:hypothetical protein
MPSKRKEPKRKEVERLAYAMLDEFTAALTASRRQRLLDPVPVNFSKDWNSALIAVIRELRSRPRLSDEELSKRLGPSAERALARYTVRKSHLQREDFVTIADALEVEPQRLARMWASAVNSTIVRNDPVQDVLLHTYLHESQRRPGVPASPSPITVIRGKYATRLPREVPPLWVLTTDAGEPTPKAREIFVRGYTMLVQAVLDNMTFKEIGAVAGIQATRATALMERAAYAWARSEGIDLLRQTIPWKNEDRTIAQFYSAISDSTENHQVSS